MLTTVMFLCGVVFFIFFSTAITVKIGKDITLRHALKLTWNALTKQSP